MKKILLMLTFLFLLSGCATTLDMGGYSDTDATMKNWKYAKQFQAEGRYELAKQYYLLALTSVRSKEAMDQLERELFNVELQIRTMR